MFLEDIALRSDIKYLFLFFLILLSCGKNHKEYAKMYFLILVSHKRKN